MATTIGDIVVRMGMDNRGFSRGADATRKDLKGLNRETGPTLTGFGSLERLLPGSASGLLSVASAAGSAAAPIAALAGTVTLLSSAFSEAAEFGRTFTSSMAIQDLDASTLDEFRQHALDLASDPAVKGFAGDLAQGYEYLALAGLDTEKQLASLRPTALFAMTDASFSMAEATDFLTDSQTALGLASTDTAQHLLNLNRVSDVFVKGSTTFNASSRQIAESITNDFGGAIKLLGKDVEEGVALLGAFADQGVKGVEAGTKGSIVLRDLQTKAIENEAAFKRFGLAVFDDQGEMRNLADIIGDLETKMAGLSDKAAKSTLLDLGFTDKSVGALQLLLGTSDKIRAYEAAMRDAGGTTEDVANRKLTPLDAASKRLSATWDKMLVTLGEPMQDGSASVIERLADGLERTMPLIELTADGIGLLSDTFGIAAEGFDAIGSGIDYVGGVVGGLSDRVGNAINTFEALGVPIDAINEKLREAIRFTFTLGGLLGSDELGTGADLTFTPTTGDAILNGLLGNSTPDGAGPSQSPLFAGTSQPDFEFLGNEKTGNQSDRTQQSLAELRTRAMALDDALAAGSVTADEHATALRAIREAYDEATGGAGSLIVSLEREIQLVGMTAAQRERMALLDAEASTHDINRVGALQRQLAVQTALVDQSRQLADQQFGRETVDLAQSLEVDPAQFSSLNEQIEQYLQISPTLDASDAGQMLSDLRDKATEIGIEPGNFDALLALESSQQRLSDLQKADGLKSRFAVPDVGAELADLSRLEGLDLLDTDTFMIGVLAARDEFLSGLQIGENSPFQKDLDALTKDFASGLLDPEQFASGLAGLRDKADQIGIDNPDGGGPSQSGPRTSSAATVNSGEAYSRLIQSLSRRDNDPAVAEAKKQTSLSAQQLAELRRLADNSAANATLLIE